MLFAKKYFSPLTPLVKYSTVVKAHFDVGCVKVFAEKYFLLPRNVLLAKVHFFKKKSTFRRRPLLKYSTADESHFGAAIAKGFLQKLFRHTLWRPFYCFLPFNPALTYIRISLEIRNHNQIAFLSTIRLGPKKFLYFRIPLKIRNHNQIAFLTGFRVGIRSVPKILFEKVLFECSIHQDQTKTILFMINS